MIGNLHIYLILVDQKQSFVIWLKLCFNYEDYSKIMILSLLRILKWTANL